MTKGIKGFQKGYTPHNKGKKTPHSKLTKKKMSIKAKERVRNGTHIGFKKGKDNVMKKENIKIKDRKKWEKWLKIKIIQ